MVSYLSKVCGSCKFCSKIGWVSTGNKLTDNLQFRSGREAAPFFVGGAICVEWLDL